MKEHHENHAVSPTPEGDEEHFEVWACEVAQGICQMNLFASPCSCSLHELQFNLVGATLVVCVIVHCQYLPQRTEEIIMHNANSITAPTKGGLGVLYLARTTLKGAPDVELCVQSCRTLK
jgi:hypothetical protein